VVNHSSVSNPLPPQPTTRVGRSSELSRFAELLADPACRLLTLVGPGGIGKTRLAIEAARQFPNAQFVPLQPLTSPDFIVSAIAEAVGFQFYSGADPKQQLLDFLHDKAWLLLLDNFEHLLDGATLLSNMLAAAPKIRLLVTSRERLRLVEEWVADVEGLAYPFAETDANAEGYGAVELFLQRAKQVKVSFALTDTNRPEIVRICRLVGGFPLGIELAASQARILACEAIADEIERSLDILETPARNVEPRHRTMRAAFEPTWARLSDEERAVFIKVSVFRGGFTREAAKAVAGASLRTLSALVDKSLLRVDASGRYDLHELLLQYAEEQLKRSGGTQTARDAHSCYYADFVHQRVEDMKGRRQLEAIAESRTDFANLGDAWRWAIDHKSLSSIEKMLEGLWLFCTLCGWIIELKSSFGYAESQLAGKPDPACQRLWGRLRVRMSDETEADIRQLETALQIARDDNDLLDIAFCLERLGFTAYHHQDYPTARQLGVQSLQYYRRFGDRYYVANMLRHLLTLSYREGWDTFYQLGKEAYDLSREIGDQIGAIWSFSVLAHGEARLGHFSEAERMWLERAALGEAIGGPGHTATSYAHVSYAVYFIQGDFAKARAAAETGLQLATKHVSYSGIKWSLTALGLLACMEERYQEAKDLCQKAASAVGGLAWASDLALFGQCLANCGLGDYPTAHTDLSTLLPRIKNIPGLAGVVLCLPVAAILLSQVGAPNHAVELLGLAFNHPAHASGWMERWPLLTRLRDKLQVTLGTEVYSAAWERGQWLGIEAIEVKLHELFSGEFSLLKASASPSFASPLSERELEILCLVAEGHSNQEIAERLYVGVSTVKKHINHIYHKLDARNRIEAVTLARERQLLPR
jgi:predicted ATPase/DNA-binding CsgD family transcriptional regulator